MRNYWRRKAKRKNRINKLSSNQHIPTWEKKGKIVIVLRTENYLSEYSTHWLASSHLGFCRERPCSVTSLAVVDPKEPDGNKQMHFKQTPLLIFRCGGQFWGVRMPLTLLYILKNTMHAFVCCLAIFRDPW